MTATTNPQYFRGIPSTSLFRASALTFAAFVQVLTGGGCGQSNASSVSDRPIVDVQVVAAESRPWVRRVRVTGTLHGDEETTLATKVPGRVAQVFHDLGDIVPAGEPLLQVDPTDVQLARDERVRAYRETLAQLGLTEVPSEDFNVASLPSVERARLQMENAKSRYERGQSLMAHDPPLISTQDLADMKTAWDVSQSNLQGEHLSAAATLAQARTLDAQINIAEQRVIDTLHRAPVPVAAHETGEATSRPRPASNSTYEVAAKLVSVGDYVQVGTPLFRLVDADPVKLRATAPERLAHLIKIGQQVAVTTESLATPFEGAVNRISPAVDAQTRTFLLEITVPNPKGELKPGSFATAQINVGTENITAVPEPSIVVFAGVTKVFMVKDGKLEERRVDTGERNEGWIEIRKGLEPGEQVVSQPTGSMTAGMPARVTASTENSVARP